MITSMMRIRIITATARLDIRVIDIVIERIRLYGTRNLAVIPGITLLHGPLRPFFPTPRARSVSELVSGTRTEIGSPYLCYFDSEDDYTAYGGAC